MKKLNTFWGNNTILLQNYAEKINNYKLLHNAFFWIILTTTGEIIALQEALSKRKGRIDGGLSFELQARKALADILVGAVEDVKKRLVEKQMAF